MRRHCVGILVATAISIAIVHTPRDAQACGGTFCDGAGAMPMSMPVDQTGENIFFVVADGEVEAHIQIQYDPATDATQFAWIVPVMATPSFEVGAQQMFINLANATVPSYGWVGQNQSCGGGGFDDGGFGSCGMSSGAGSSASGADTTGGGDDGGTSGGGTEVVLQDTVGAFEAVVLESTTAVDLLEWLTTNGYYADPNAEPILQQYIDEGAQFAAFRLSQSAGIGEIHPVVIRYAGDEPCIPIRLTQIAAQDDMDIRAFFLGEARVVPTNYRHVELNPVKLDWFTLGDNYKDVVTMAVDEPMADGHAFVTEYAGTSDVVARDGLFSETWNAAAFAAIAPEDVVTELQSQGLMSACDADTCIFLHPLLRGLLLAFLPPPDGQTEGAFWGDLPTNVDAIDPVAWDATGFSLAIDERIILPGAHALDLLDTHPTLTRLYTTISPPEMTEDPLFHTSLELGEVNNTARIATLYRPCAGNPEMQGLGIGMDVDVDFSNTWPDIAPEQMPWALRIETVPPVGAPMVLVDNEMAIDMLIGEWNASQIDRGPLASCHDDGGGFDGSGSGSSSGSSGSGGLDSDGPSGCGCRADDDSSPIAAMLVLLLGVRRSRRSRAS